VSYLSLLGIFFKFCSRSMALVNIYKIPTLEDLVCVGEVADDALGSQANTLVMFLSIKRNANH